MPLTAPDVFSSPIFIDFLSKITTSALAIDNRALSCIAILVAYCFAGMTEMLHKLINNYEIISHGCKKLSNSCSSMGLVMDSLNIESDRQK